MWGITLFSLIALAQASNTVPPEIDQLNNLSLDEFEDNFGLDHDKGGANYIICNRPIITGNMPNIPDNYWKYGPYFC